MCLGCVNTPSAGEGILQMTPPPSRRQEGREVGEEEGEEWQDKHLGPIQQMVIDYPLAAKLDRILLIWFEDGETDAVWFRLIGPGISINLELVSPDHGFVEAAMALSMKAIPKCHRGMVEIDVKTCSYFADLCFFVHQHGLHRWDFSRNHNQQRSTQFLSWAYRIIACLMHRNALILRTCIFGGDPLAFLTRSIPGLFRTRDAGRRDEMAVRKAELQIYVDWRLWRLRERHWDEIGLQDTQDTLDMHFRQMAWWLHCIAVMQSNGAEPSRQDWPRLLSPRLFGSAAL